MPEATDVGPLPPSFSSRQPELFSTFGAQTNAWADYDGDGDLDLYLLNYGANVLYRNEGDGTFNDVSVSQGVDHPGWGASAVWLDFDLDGDLDLFVTNYVDWSPARELECFSGGAERAYCHPRHFNAPAADVLYRNDGDRFTDVTKAAGIWKARSTGLGVVASDFNVDGWPDLYVANDGMPNQLWINGGDGTFEDRALISGTAVNINGTAEAGMGIAVADLENDGDPDLFVTHLRGETNTLYLNDGGFFEDVTATTGLAAASVALTGFGTGFADFDNDGDVDLLAAGSMPPLFEVIGPGLASPGRLYENDGAGGFSTAATYGLEFDFTSGLAVADYDGDGRLDLAIGQNNGPTVLLHNRGGRVGVRVRLRGSAVNPHGIGAMLRVIYADGLGPARELRLGSGYWSVDDPVAVLGLRADPQGIEVRWPDGSLTSLSAVAVDQLLTVSK